MVLLPLYLGLSKGPRETDEFDIEGSVIPSCGMINVCIIGHFREIRK